MYIGSKYIMILYWWKIFLYNSYTYNLNYYYIVCWLGEEWRYSKKKVISVFFFWLVTWRSLMLIFFYLRIAWRWTALMKKQSFKHFYISQEFLAVFFFYIYLLRCSKIQNCTMVFSLVSRPMKFWGLSIHSNLIYIPFFQKIDWSFGEAIFVFIICFGKSIVTHMVLLVCGRHIDIIYLYKAKITKYLW